MDGEHHTSCRQYAATLHGEVYTCMGVPEYNATPCRGSWIRQPRVGSSSSILKWKEPVADSPSVRAQATKNPRTERERQTEESSIENAYKSASNRNVSLQHERKWAVRMYNFKMMTLLDISEGIILKWLSKLIWKSWIMSTVGVSMVYFFVTIHLINIIRKLYIATRCRVLLKCSG